MRTGYDAAFILALIAVCPVISFRKYSSEDVIRLREDVREMFQHAYEGYLTYASNYDELRPLSCDGIDTWGSYSLTLIDALDTLAVMGNFSEFRRVVGILTTKTNFDSDINVSVFETNIRIVGGLLSAHLMSLRAGLDLEPGWPCNGPLLRLAEDVARRILPAFDTKTGMPYGTVNLRHGVPAGETTVTCTAGVGTFIVEFGALSRLTGDPIYEEVALNALYALWKHRSPIGLFGNHIDVQTGRWTAQDAGIGAGVDSYYEYLVKGALMLNRPELLEMFHAGREAIDKYLKRDDWHVWVSMNKGQVTLPVFQSLEAYWPGVLSLIGDIGPAMKTLHNYHSVWKQYGFLPEFYNIPSAEAGTNRENYPLRPELIESVMYLYRATSDPYLLEVGEDMLRSIQYSAKTSCGYATIKNVRDHRKEDRMESFFLAETTKYLYLLFDPDNFLHNDGREGIVHETPNGICIIQAGGYIFNTEAHPIDPSALRCCHDNQDWFKDFTVEKFLGEELQRKADTNQNVACPEESLKRPDMENFTIEIETTIDPDLTQQKMIAEIMSNVKSMGGNDSDENNSKAEVLEDVKVKEEENLPVIEEERLTLAERSELLKKTMVQEEELKKMTANMNSSEPITSQQMERLEAKIITMVSILEIFVEDYLRKMNTTVKSILDHMPTNKISPDYNNVRLMTATYQSYAQERLTLDIMEGIHILHGELNKTAPENILKSVVYALIHIKLRADESFLKANYPKLMELFLTAQDDYEKYLAEKSIIVELFSYVSQIKDESLQSKEDIGIIIKLIEIIKDKKNRFTDARNRTRGPLRYELFEHALRMLLDTVGPTFNLPNLMGNASLFDITENVKSQLKLQEKNQTMPTNTSSSRIRKNEVKTETNDDIILKDRTTGSPATESYNQNVERPVVQDIDADEDIGHGTVEPVIFDTEMKDEIENVSIEEAKISTQSKLTSNNNSALTDFLQLILKSTVSSRRKFEPQLFLEKIRANGFYNNQSQNFKLFTCRAQPFLQRISIIGEFF